jgi:hypothetical protein
MISRPTPAREILHGHVTVQDWLLAQKKIAGGKGLKKPGRECLS